MWLCFIWQLQFDDTAASTPIVPESDKQTEPNVNGEMLSHAFDSKVSLVDDDSEDASLREDEINPKSEKTEVPAEPKDPPMKDAPSGSPSSQPFRSSPYVSWTWKG